MKENAANLNSQAIELASNGQYYEAIACLKKALTMENNNYLLWFNLGLTYRDSGDLAEAKKAVEMAYKLNNQDDEVLETIALINLNLELYEEAISSCNEGLERNNKNSHIWNTLGVVYFNTENFNSACECFEQAVTLNPYYYDALFNLRDTYEELGNQAGVYQCIQQMKNMQKNF